MAFRTLNSSMMTTTSDYDVVIAGGGPAGTSAAIHLATRGTRVLLAEQKKFPRAKLCGEFISPECLDHFERLGVSNRMMTAGGARLTQTVFYSRGGRSVNVPSDLRSQQHPSELHPHFNPPSRPL